MKKMVVLSMAAVLVLMAVVCRGADLPVVAVFKGLEPGKMPVITVTNTGDLDIDDILGGFSLLDSDGTVLFSTGYTSMVTGSVWLAAGQSIDMSLYITQAAQERNPAGRKKLVEQPYTIRVVFSPRMLTFIE